MSDQTSVTVTFPNQLLDALLNMKSANPKVQTAEDHLKEAVRMYALFHTAHQDGKYLYLGENAQTAERCRLFV